ncbi:Uma2 family endonuclease [Amycolatopsis aidingensis]|uniref:Uma2 family endonuclease n=1 Tax=Amycolatopsis aidingensis TaxID=2842453 RepID=UPI001C0B5071|nr:Uma2 family endonuclease [Amycolatopsis aidingensis]
MDHPLGPLTIEDWLATASPTDGSHLELVLGYRHVTPPPSGSHQYAVAGLYRALEDARDTAGRAELSVLPGIGVRISTPWRTALIPDVAMLDTDPHHTSFAAENLLLAVEVWSPGNTRAERDTKMAAYAGAGVPYLWTVEPPKLWAYRLAGTGYRQELFTEGGGPVTLPGPVPVPLDPSRLC